MNELISIETNSERPVVSGRELHEKLGIKTAYKDWFPRMAEYGFEEGEDFNPLKNEQVRMEGDREVCRTVTDHLMTLDMAKQICMIQRSEAGKRYREYFLEVERKWNSPEAVLARALQASRAALDEMQADNERLAQRVEMLQNKADYFDQVADAEGLTSFRETAKLFGIPEKKFIKSMEEHDYCYRDSRNRLMPYAGKLRSGLFEVKEATYTGLSGTHTTIYTKITPKGRTVIWQAIRKEFADEV